MKTENAAKFAIETVRTAKNTMIENGFIDAQLIFATCKKLAAILGLDFETVTLIFENV